MQEDFTSGDLDPKSPRVAPGRGRSGKPGKRLRGCIIFGLLPLTYPWRLNADLRI
jgi:hypothetical protein